MKYSPFNADLTHLEFRVVASMSELGTSVCTCSQITEALQLNYHSIYRVLERLSKDGIILRNSEPHLKFVTYSLMEEK